MLLIFKDIKDERDIEIGDFVTLTKDTMAFAKGTILKVTDIDYSMFGSGERVYKCVRPVCLWDDGWWCYEKIVQFVTDEEVLCKLRSL